MSTSARVPAIVVRVGLALRQRPPSTFANKASGFFERAKRDRVPALWVPVVAWVKSSTSSSKAAPTASAMRFFNKSATVAPIVSRGGTRRWGIPSAVQIAPHRFSFA